MTAEQKPAGKPAGPGQAHHGYRNEVNWEGGSGRHGEPSMGRAQFTGRQPYGNQDAAGSGPAAGGGYAQGNRAEQSGQNLDQLERVKRRP